jgi:hypothetical protein
MDVYAEVLLWLVELCMHTLEVRVDGVKDGGCDFLTSFCHFFCSPSASSPLVLLLYSAIIMRT